MHEESLQRQLEKAHEDAARLDDQQKSERKERSGARSRSRVKKFKLGNSQELHEEKDWPWDMSESEWDGTEDKQERNRVRKEKERKKRKERREKAAEIGRCTIGLGPIHEDSIEYFYNITADFNEAKKMAGAEFLEGYLKYDKRDMEEINITDTKISGKGDNMLISSTRRPRTSQEYKKTTCRL